MFVGCALSAQVAVREDATAVRLDKAPTTVAVAMRNSSNSLLQAVLTLEWIRPDGKPVATAHRAIELTPGESKVEVALPLPAVGNPLTERLQYRITPGDKNYSAFDPQQGILSLPEIARDAFTLSIATADDPRRGSPYPIHVFAAHPVTRRPVSGVAIRYGKVSMVTGADGTATLQIPIQETDDDDSVTIEGRLGDYIQARELSLPPRPDTVNIYTDKPLYQPGQTVHVRILSLSSAGPVRAILEHEIRVLDEQRDVLFDARVKTSRFGIASADWPIPENAKSGHYTIQAGLDDADSTFMHDVEIRRYELPSFRVTAKPDRTFYLNGQKAAVDVAAEYLFGKPVEHGTVRVAAENSDQTIAAGDLKDGHFKASIDAGEVSEQMQFSDRHLLAYVTDASTNRTEQRKFDLRVSRFPINLYVAKEEQTQHEEVVYVSAYLPDGQPARATVSVIADGKTLTKSEANRYGLARLTFARGRYESLAVRVITPEGIAEQPLSLLMDADSRLWLATDHTLYRPGQSVRCHITAEVKDGPGLLFAWNADGQAVLSKKFMLAQGAADIDIPYQAQFGNQVSIGVSSPSVNSAAARTVIFVGATDFNVRATPGAASYRPGDLATVKFETSNAAALGVAIVDESVFERAQTDAVARRWFDYGAEQEISGIRARDLARLNPSQIDDDLQLVAAVLVPAPAFAMEGDDLDTEIRDAFIGTAGNSLAPLRDALNAHYADTLEFPHNQDELQGILGYQYTVARDPWLEPWYPEFATEGSNYVLRLVSSGPDKKYGTSDDFVGLEVRRNWFMPYQALMAQQLKQITDYPATGDEFNAIVRKAGIDFNEVRDPWGSGLRVVVAYEQQRRVIRILSAASDARWNTGDDFVVCEFSGYYFRAAERKIQHAMFAQSGFPKDEADARTRLKDGGVDIDSLRDPWNRPYYLTFSTEDSWGDNVEIFSYAEYKHPVEQRRTITPVKRHLLVLQIRSAGADGLRGTYDDFSVAVVRRVAQDEKASVPPSQLGTLPAGHIAGTGTIRGQVRDQTGAVIAQSHLVLNGLYESETDQNGEYEFSAVPPGVYELRAEAMGFQRYQLAALPVEADRITEANIVLVVGSASQTVEVSANVLKTESAESAVVKQPISTPHVREYFPETLFWAPEVITGKDGLASVRVKLADSITTWRVAVIASTTDGKIAESDAVIKAFQPLLADLNIPQILTEGDSVSVPVPIRNYSGQTQQVTVSSALAESLGSGEIERERLTVPASSSANAVLKLRALSSAQSAPVQVSVIGGSASDAIKKTIEIHPDGERREMVINGVVAENRPLQIEIPAAAIPGSVQAQITIFPSLLSRILASMRALLTRPYGCAEQTISATYPNLLFLRALRHANLHDHDLEVRAERNLRDGYDRLFNYQDAAGAFSYWGRDDKPDVALTAYAVEFLQGASALIPVEPERLERARKWLTSHAAEDASVSALRLHSLLQAGKVPAVDEELGKVAREASRLNDPYAVAQYALAAISAGKMDLARQAVANLQKSVKDEQGTAYWDLRANTPFHGWGRAGQIETTALVIAALAKWGERNGDDSELSTLIERGVLFLFRNAGPDGAWPTTQATVKTLDALLSVWKGAERRTRTTMMLAVNKQARIPVILQATDEVQGPVTIDISRDVLAGAVNQVSVEAGGVAMQVQTTALWYQPWNKPERAETLEFAAKCGPATLAINELSQCDVSIGRREFRGYGMLIADIGLPPGADVDRGSLTALVEAGTIDSYEIAPDHIVIYVWPQAAGAHFRFGFRPRFAMHAKAALSLLYDYYNPDEKVVLQPTEFQVK